MKFLIAVSCLLAVASAGFVGHTAYTYPHVVAHAQHVPVIGPNGVPLDEPAVAAAKAHHAAAHVEAQVRNGDAAVVAHHAVAPVAYAGHVAAPVAYAGHYGYAGPQHIPVIGANGVPVDEPAVAAARAHHAAAHVEAKVRNGDAAFVAHHAVAPVAYAAHHVAAPVAYAAHVAAPVAHGVPLDTPEVAAAKAEHFAAHVEAKARNGAFHHYAPLVHYRKRRGIFHAAPFTTYAAAPVAHYAGPQHLPVIGANGVPVDEPAVAVARAEHAAAHVEAKVRNGDAAVVAHHVAAPVAYAAHVETPVVAHVAAHYAGPQHLPVIGANGVPVDEPAVAAARAHHAAAHVEAKVRNGDAAFVAHHAVAPVAYAAHHVAAPVAYSGHYAYGQHVPVVGAHGVPLDTPEVAAAKAHHAAAHIEAKVRNGDLHHFAAPVVHAY